MTNEYKDESDASAEEVERIREIVKASWATGGIQGQPMGESPHAASMADVARHKEEDEFNAWAQNPYSIIALVSMARNYVPIADHRKLQEELAAANKRADDARAMAMAIEDAVNLCRANADRWGAGNGYIAHELAAKIRTLITFPPSHGVVPLSTIELCIGILEDHTTRHNGEDRYRSVINQLLAARQK